jgi:pimeloyl-ACP methyl ester carboxylesterase
VSGGAGRGPTVVDAGGERVDVIDTGRRDGPPLLITSGLGGAWFDWNPTVALLWNAHHVIVFDRPGLGRSPSGRTPPSLRRDVRIMEALAERAGAPLTVLAHSMGAFAAEALARIHPKLVNGIVLVDPSHEEAPRPWPRVAAVLHPLTRALGGLMEATRIARSAGPGARRVVLRFTSDRDDTVPQRVVRDVYGRGAVLGTILAEELAYREMAADLAALRLRRPFPAIPVVVLTALGDAPEGPRAREWSRGHRSLAAMSPLGRQVELPGAKHMLQLDRPDAVADAVAAVLE